MKQIEKITWKVRKPSEDGFFHDTRGDMAIVRKCITRLIEKINEIIEKVNEIIELKNEIDILKKEVEELRHGRSE